MKVALVVAVLAAAITGGCSILLSEGQKTAALNSHNSARSASYGSDELALVWDDELAGLAEKLANECNFAHGHLKDVTLTYHTGPVTVGQNNYYKQLQNMNVSVSTQMIEDMVNGWDSEKQFFTYGEGDSYPTCAEHHACGHYTQVVWAETSKVGCAYQKCTSVAIGTVTWENVLIFVCDYYTAGNKRDQNLNQLNPYKEGVPCSACDHVVEAGSAYKCSDNLCKVCTSPTETGCQCPPVSCVNGQEVVNGCGCDCSGTGFFGKECDKPCQLQEYVSHCTQWKAGGLCADDMYKGFMQEYCAKICGLHPAGAC